MNDTVTTMYQAQCFDNGDREMNKTPCAFKFTGQGDTGQKTESRRVVQRDGQELSELERPALVMKACCG